MRWARHHYDALPWVGTGPRWHLIATSNDGALMSACRRPVLPPFDIEPETPPKFRCRKCDSQVRAGEVSQWLGTRPARPTPMGDKQRHLLRLRAIVVSGNNALRKTTSSDGRELVKNRITALLAELEEAVIRDGAEPELLARVDEARREVWE